MSDSHFLSAVHCQTAHTHASATQPRLSFGIGLGNATDFLTQSRGAYKGEREGKSFQLQMEQYGPLSGLSAESGEGCQRALPPDDPLILYCTVARLIMTDGGVIT